MQSEASPRRVSRVLLFPSERWNTPPNQSSPSECLDTVRHFLDDDALLKNVQINLVLMFINKRMSLIQQLFITVITVINEL